MATKKPNQLSHINQAGNPDMVDVKKSVAKTFTIMFPVRMVTRTRSGDLKKISKNQRCFFLGTSL